MPRLATADARRRPRHRAGNPVVGPAATRLDATRKKFDDDASRHQSSPARQSAAWCSCEDALTCPIIPAPTRRQIITPMPILIRRFPDGSTPRREATSGFRVNASGRCVNASSRRVNVLGLCVNASSRCVNASRRCVNVLPLCVNALSRCVNASRRCVNALPFHMNALGLRVNATPRRVNATGRRMNATGRRMNATGRRMNATGLCIAATESGVTATAYRVTVRGRVSHTLRRSVKQVPSGNYSPLVLGPLDRSYCI